MKKFCPPTVLLLLFVTAFSSFEKGRGGDVVEIYLNGNRVHQQFVHADQSAKAVRLPSFKANDRLDVSYSHCGTSGKGRVLILRNEKNELLQELKFADAADNRSRMSFFHKDLQKFAGQKISLHYRSKELPQGRLLAVISWNATENIARR